MHGLGGTSASTWTRTDADAQMWLLGLQSEANIRVMCYEYDSETPGKICWRQGIREEAMNLLDALSDNWIGTTMARKFHSPASLTSCISDYTSFSRRFFFEILTFHDLAGPSQNNLSRT